MRALIAVIALLGAASCPKLPPLPAPTPVSTPTPGPTPTPTVPPQVCQPIPDGPGVVAQSPRPPAQYTGRLNSVLQSLYGGEVGSRVRINEPLEVSLNRVVAALKAVGVCVGIQAGADEVCIMEGVSGTCQGYHVFTCDPGCTTGVVGWAPGSVRDTWHQVETPPITGPGPVAGCPPGTPPPGQYVISCHVKPANPNMDFCDSTPKVIDRDYCAPNVVCPYKGGEGSGDRIACERALAWPVWTGADQRDDNPFSADAPRGAPVKVCARDYPGTCAEAVTP